MIAFFLFTVVPIVGSAVLSFTHFNMLQAPTFAGFSNYVKLFLEDDVFLTAVRNTVVFAVITGPLSYFACLFVAILINGLNPKVRSVLTFIFYAPSISAMVYVMWTYIFSGDMYGMINSLFMRLGLINEPTQWLTDPKTILGVVIFVQIWMSLGTSFLAFIAGLQNIDRQLYEAGAVDGIRTRWQEVFYITLPSMGPQLMFSAVMQISIAFSVGAICVTLVGFPSTDNAGLTIMTHIQDYGNIRFEMGYASAISVVLFVFILLLNRFIQRFIRKRAEV
jgi:multiple sugar transport system permease protein